MAGARARWRLAKARSTFPRGFCTAAGAPWRRISGLGRDLSANDCAWPVVDAQTPFLSERLMMLGMPTAGRGSMRSLDLANGADRIVREFVDGVEREENL